MILPPLILLLLFFSLSLFLILMEKLSVRTKATRSTSPRPRHFSGESSFPPLLPSRTLGNDHNHDRTDILVSVLKTFRFVRNSSARCRILARTGSREKGRRPCAHVDAAPRPRPDGAESDKVQRIINFIATQFPRESATGGRGAHFR